MLNGSPTGTRAQSMSLLRNVSDLVAGLSTAVMTSVAVPLEVGDLVTNITFLSGATACVTPANWWFALYSPAGALLGQTADQTTTAWAANTPKTLPLTTAYRVTTAGVYYPSIMVKAATVPTLTGVTLVSATAAGALLSSVILAQTSGSALTDTAPATIATPTTVKTVPFCIVT